MVGLFWEWYLVESRVEHLSLCVSVCETCHCERCVEGGWTRGIGRCDLRVCWWKKTTQVTESDTVMGMRFEAQPLVVVEDHMQFSPVVQSLSCNKVGLDKSMFQRLMGLSVCPVCLKLHSHMHPPLSAFPSATFHKGILQNGISTTKRAHIHMCFSTQTDTCTHH